ncbi:MAG: hypothetical protein M3342_11065 [Bacteroidota bacterium]|nr:hypothetical protein [Bacteroidota bacterium]
MKAFSYWSTIIISCILTCCLTYCSVQHDNTKPFTRTAAFPRVIERAKKDKRYFIMHSGVDTFVITSVLVERSKQQFTVHLNRLDSLHRVNMNNSKSLAGKQIHVYMRDSTSYTLDEPHTIPLSRVARIELID